MRVVRRAAWILLLMLPTVLLHGCIASNLADVIKAAGTDPATVCVRVTSVYGTLTFLRSNIGVGQVGCDALTVKSDPVTPTVGLPITIQPQFRIVQ